MSACFTFLTWSRSRYVETTTITIPTAIPRTVGWKPFGRSPTRTIAASNASIAPTENAVAIVPLWNCSWNGVPFLAFRTARLALFASLCPK